MSDVSEVKRDLLARTHHHIIFLLYVHHKTANQDIQFVCWFVFNFFVFAYVTKKPLPDIQAVICFLFFF